MAIYSEHLKGLLDVYEAFDGNNELRQDLAKVILKATAQYLGINLAQKEDQKGPFVAEGPFVVVGNNEMTAEEHQLARAGQKIPAIKKIRERTHMGLKEAKDLYERFYPNH